MTFNDNTIWDRLDYTLISIAKTSSPDSADNVPWYKYILGRGTDCLVCQSRGSLQEVTEHAEQLATDLNSRRGVKTGTYGNYRQKPAGNTSR